MTGTSEAVAREIEPILEREGFELVVVQHKAARGSARLTVMLDKEAGVTVDDCEKVSRLIGPILDASSLVDTGYTLEVSSPGFDRPLTKETDYVRFAGQPARIKTHMPIDGVNVFSGTLGGLSGSAVLLDADGGRMEIPVSEIAAARLDL